MKYNMMCSLFFILSIPATSQNLQISKIIVDGLTKKPLENVSIFNDKDNSVSNADGLFVFFSDKNEINFNLLGYFSKTTNFAELKTEDTIFMKPKVFELNEVVVTNLEPYIKKVYDDMANNFISNYTSNFFLRNILKSDTAITKLQDINGKRNKNNNQKDNTKIEILNMRKISLFEKKNRVELKFPDFNEFFSISFPEIDKYIFEEVNYNDSNYKKILFEAKEKDNWEQIRKGYFVINRKDYAIIEFYVEMVDNIKDVPYKKIMILGTQYRTTKYNRLVRFTKSAAFNKYYLSNSKLDCEVEVLADKRIEKTFYYALAMDYFVTNSPKSEIINSNFSVDNDVFKAKFPYSENFWSNQNQLPLTSELKDFLKRVSDNKEKKREFEIIGNF